MKEHLQFSIKEYETLRLESRDAVQESRIIERQTILASGVVWAWVLTQPNLGAYTNQLKYIPLTVSLFGAIRSFGLHVRLVRISEHIIAMEQRFGRGSYFSWETQLSRKSWVLTGTSTFFWISMLSANLYATRML